ncbi:hypothetical protein WA538_001064, partial [Blastocystis sp. DL]
MVAKASKQKKPSRERERVIRAILFLKELARNPSQPTGNYNKSEKSTIVEIRKLMFVKPEKRPTNRQRIEASSLEVGYKCEKCGCKSDISICPWHRQKVRRGGVDIHSYPRRMSPLQQELERRLLVVTNHYLDKRYPNNYLSNRPYSKKSRFAAEQESQDIIMLNKWNPHEVAVFEAAISVFGKQFHKISDLIPTKTTQEVVAFYSLWHFTSHYCLWKNQQQ